MCHIQKMVITYPVLNLIWSVFYCSWLINWGHSNIIAVTHYSVVCLQLFGGFLVSLNSLPVWLRWLKYLSLFRYSIEVSATTNFLH